jgi:hypothetical protein
LFKKRKTQKTAFSQKIIGTSPTDIKKFLISSGLTESDSASIVTRLPCLKKTSEAFDQLIISKSESNVSDSSIEIIFTFGICIILILMSAVYSKVLLVPAVFIAIVAFYLYSKNSKTLINGTQWLELINSSPHEFIWIKPIEIKYKLYHLITINQENYFQVLLKDGDFLKIKLITIEEKKIFFDGIKAKLPHLQFGYSPEIEKQFQYNSETFISALEILNIYTPIDRIQLVYSN